jgi:Na+-transporting NADH:ubiquinone oxidoreductase subunit C
MSRETIGRTFTVAGVLSVLCAVVVAGAAVALKPTQEANKARDMKKNILAAAGLLSDGADINQVFEQNIKARLLDLSSGEYVEDQDALAYDFRKAVKDKNSSAEIPASKDIAKIRRQAKLMTVYEVVSDAGLEKVVLPVYGKGLWSTLYGFVALNADTKTVVGLGFYEHAETPGLGGEVDNPKWKKQWAGKEVYGENGQLALTVLKGKVDPSSAEAKHQIDGLSGATITTVGVDALIKFWLGADGYGRYLDNLRRKGDLNG